MDGFGVAVARQPCGELIGQVEQPDVTGFGRQQDKLTNSDDAPMAVSSPGMDVADLVGEAKALPSTICLPGRRRIAFRSLPGVEGAAMDLFTKLFGDFLVFVYPCFDWIVIRGYLTALFRPESWSSTSSERSSRWRRSARRRRASGRPITRIGWKPTRAITRSRSNGPRRRRCGDTRNRSVRAVPVRPGWAGALRR